MRTGEGVTERALAVILIPLCWRIFSRASHDRNGSTSAALTHRRGDDVWPCARIGPREGDVDAHQPRRD
jgi:hypothetical protein